MNIKKLLQRLRDPEYLMYQAFVPLVPPEGTKLGNLYGASDLSSFVNGLFKFAIAIGAIGAVIRLAYAGYLYMGSDMWSHKSEAKEVIGDVTLGILLLLAIWLILYQINPDILKLNALKNIKPVRTAPSEISPGGTQQFTVQPAPNSFFGGAGGAFDSSINGVGVSGNETGNAEPVSP